MPRLQLPCTTTCICAQLNPLSIAPPGFVDREDGEGNPIEGGWRTDDEPCTGMQSVSQTSSNRYTLIFYFVDTRGVLQQFATSSKIILLVQQGKYNGSVLTFVTHINKDSHIGCIHVLMEFLYSRKCFSSNCVAHNQCLEVIACTHQLGNSISKRTCWIRSLASDLCRGVNLLRVSATSRP